MGKNKGKYQLKSDTPEQSVIVAPPKVEEAPAAAAPNNSNPVAAPAQAETPILLSPSLQAIKDALEAQVKAGVMTQDVMDKALKQVAKLEQDASRNEAVKKFSAFNELVNKELPTWLAEKAKASGVELTGRYIKVTFPKGGEPKVVHAPIGAREGNGEGSGRGFGTSWGEATLVDKDGKETKHSSPSKLASFLNLQVEGHRNMPDVFENPTESGTKKELPKTYKVEAERGKYFKVTII